LRNLTKKRDGKRKKSSSRCRAILCERTDSLKALDSVAGYLENGLFHPINDTQKIYGKKREKIQPGIVQCMKNREFPASERGRRAVG
jgi:hypothetical protein